MLLQAASLCVKEVKLPLRVFFISGYTAGILQDATGSIMDDVEVTPAGPARPGEVSGDPSHPLPILPAPANIPNLDRKLKNNLDRATSR